MTTRARSRRSAKRSPRETGIKCEDNEWYYTNDIDMDQKVEVKKEILHNGKHKVMDNVSAQDA